MGLESRSPNSCPFTDLCRGNERADGKAVFLQFHRNFAESFKLIPGSPELTQATLVHSELPAGGDKKMTSPQVSSAMETEKNAFPTLLPPPLTDSVPREHQGASKPHIQPLTAQQAPVRRILSTWDFILHSEIPARSESCLFPS